MTSETRSAALQAEPAASRVVVSALWLQLKRHLALFRHFRRQLPGFGWVRLAIFLVFMLSSTLGLAFSLMSAALGARALAQFEWLLRYGVLLGVGLPMLYYFHSPIFQNADVAWSGLRQSLGFSPRSQSLIRAACFAFLLFSRWLLCVLPTLSFWLNPRANHAGRSLAGLLLWGASAACAVVLGSEIYKRFKPRLTV